jgi:hypothetical protein
MKDIKRRSGVPRVLGDEAGKNFRPVLRAGCPDTASGPMPVERLDHLSSSELQSAVPLPEMPFILTTICRSLPNEVAGAPAHQDSGHGLSGRVNGLEALLICV